MSDENRSHEPRSRLTQEQILESKRMFEIDDILQVIGIWCLTEYGLECLTVYYPIPWQRLWEPDWVRHLEEKTWFGDGIDFCFALTAAKNKFAKRAGKPQYARLDVTNQVRYAVMKRDRFRCRLCGLDASTTTLHIDHIIPVCRGGGASMDNLQTLCEKCNLGKGAG